MRGSKTRPPRPVKIVVAGGFGVGKTTMVAALSDIEPLSTEKAMTSLGQGIDNRGMVTTKTTTTVAMDFGKAALEGNLMLYVFGTPGQDRFGFMWDDLARGALGAVVLVDSRRLEDSFASIDYFEARQLPYIVAVNMFEGLGAVPVDQLRWALDLEDTTPLVTVDARERESVKGAVLSLLAHTLERPDGLVAATTAFGPVR
jgi:uncharacterized protein